MRKIVVLVVLLAAVVAAGWSALWFYAAHEAGARFDAWLVREDGQGRSWTCPDRKVAGYPFALTIACTKPTYTGRTPDGTESGAAASLLVEAELMHPASLALNLGAPLTYKSADGLANITASWSRMDINLKGLPDITSVVLSGKDVAVDNFSSEGRQDVKTPVLDATFDLTQADAKPTIGFDIAAKGMPMPQLDALLGGQTPIDLQLDGRVDSKDVSGAKTLPEVIERWREQGGEVALASSRVDRGDAHVSGRGTVSLDDAHRLQGRLDASFVGLEPVLKRFGINANLANAGALLGALFGGGPSKTPAEPGALSLPINFQEGRLGIGPLRTQIALPPLY